MLFRDTSNFHGQASISFFKIRFPVLLRFIFSPLLYLPLYSRFRPPDGLPFPLRNRLFILSGLYSYVLEQLQADVSTQCISFTLLELLIVASWMAANLFATRHFAMHRDVELYSLFLCFTVKVSYPCAQVDFKEDDRDV